MRNAHGSASGLSALPNAALLRSLFINGISSRPWALSPAISLLVKSCQPKPAFLFNIAKNPVLAWLLKETVYKQFCAGEAPSEIKSTMGAMKDMGFKGTILTYAKETVFDHKNKEEFGLGMNMIPTNGASSTECPYITSWKQGTLDTVKLLGEQDQLAVKITGAGPRVTCALADNSQPPQQFLDAVDEIVRDCKARGAKILIDAESQRFQAGIMRIGLDLMRKYNRDGYAVVYNTYQAYLKSTPTSLTCHLASALDDSFTLGLKVVRGAYLATDERSLIHDTKEETDEAYDSIAAGALQQQLLGFGGEDGHLFPYASPCISRSGPFLHIGSVADEQDAVQKASNTNYISTRMTPYETQTLCIFGCGNLGRAILTKLVTWNESPFSKISAVVRTEASKRKLNEAFGKQVSVLLANEGVAAVRESDVVMLGVDPADVGAVLQKPGFRKALGEKLLISLAAGWPSTRIEDVLYGKTASGQGHAHILRALPNIAASVGQSFTALAVSAECSIPEQRIALAERIFARMGQTARVPPSLMEATTAVAGSTPAMFAVLCDALIDASVAVGMPRQMAEAMVVQSMRGSAELLLQSGGMSCATLRDAGTSPEGCTMAAIMVMEERGVRGAVGRALREAVTAARRMDSVQHVNDTWR
ncbi:Pyrroline-5-carboxylate reductase [Beauveria bassiana]|nr:Pyrroline-5-carboxylate reductase [Beauveria bassiana]